MRFTNQTILVTAAARGIGRAVVRLMLDEGGTVVAVDLSLADLETMARAMPGRARLRLVAADCLDETQVERAVGEALSVNGRIDVLVNGVGGATVVARQAAPVDEMSLDDFHQLVHFNLDPTFLVSKHVVPVMKAQRRGKIVNIASISARGEGLSSAAYGAAKAGIASLTRKLSREVAPWQVNCNAISPGVTLTERLVESFKAVPPEVQARRLEAVPLGRFATPEDQAKVIAFLASSDADFVTGVTIDVTGGQ